MLAEIAVAVATSACIALRAARGGMPRLGPVARRAAVLLTQGGEPLPLSKLQLAHEMLEENRDLLPQLPPADVRRIAGRQQISVRYEPEEALETLPALLKSPEDRDRLLVLIDRAPRRRLSAPGHLNAAASAAAARRRSGSTRNARTAGRILKAKGKERAS